MALPLPPVPDTGKITDGNDRINEDRTEINDLGTRVQPLTLGGTGGTTKPTARTGLGITSGSADPTGGADGDIYFKIV